MLAGLVGAGGVDMARMGVGVRFEWVKGKKRRRAQESNEREPAGEREGNSRPVSVISLEGDLAGLGVPSRLDGASTRSVSPDPRRRSGESKPRSRRGSQACAYPCPRRGSASPTKGRGPSSGSDEEEDSDPEDSETPWSCTLRMLPIEGGDLADPATAATASSNSNGMKLRLAHLIPAPHHPKVIGRFKMPFPFPDIAVQRLELVHRSANDPFGMSEAKAGEMVMTAEEVKDVVCTTGLWLMVREGFGGLSGKKRKGDGWKIRS